MFDQMMSITGPGPGHVNDNRISITRVNNGFIVARPSLIQNFFPGADFDEIKLEWCNPKCLIALDVKEVLQHAESLLVEIELAAPVIQKLEEKLHDQRRKSVGRAAN